MATYMIPTVSIVIPAYNHAGYLREAIDSVLGQDYGAVELIVLDDGSTDNTLEVLRSYGSRFRWETQRNMGQAATLAKGWALASGDVLGYLSADDRLEPMAVSETVGVLESQPGLVAAYPDFNLIDPDSRVVRRVEAPDYDYSKMLSEVVCLPGPGSLFRRLAYDRAGAWDPRLRQMPDYDFWLRLGLYGPFVRIPKVLASFRVHNASQTFGPVSVERANEPAMIVSRIFAHADFPVQLQSLKRTCLANAALTSAQLHIRSGRLVEGWKAVKLAAATRPQVLASARATRLLFNAVFNRIGHKVLWTVKSAGQRIHR